MEGQKKAAGTQMKKRMHSFVSGLVQGVFFRAHTQRRAAELGLGGWVRNLADGRVEVVAEGDEEKLRELEKMLRRGPPGAKVEGVETEWEEPKNGFRNFGMKHCN